MSKFTKLFLSVIALLAVSAVISCSSNDEPIHNEASENHFCKMIFNVTKIGFEDETGTRSATQWENGDTIYLLFTSGSDLVYGDAVYNDGEWFVNYNGNLIQNQETNCRAIYFENSVSSNHSTITLNENTAIYEDTVGKYTLTDGSLSLTATLKPKTGRLRFKGVNHDEVKVYGITHNTSFNRYTGEYTSTKEIIKAKVESEYSPYIYGEFTDTEEPRLNVWKAAEGFTRLFPTTIYKAGESGYVTIPTSSAHNGWQNNVILKVNRVEFTMIPVEYSSGNFLMAQTETTEELYEAIMNDGNSSQLPKEGVAYTEWESFVKKLNGQMELTFMIPSSSQWQYAAAGGTNSQRFTYSGSNSIDDVAWYEVNSNATRHEVATKQPNELGFYDMSGNVWEYTSSTESNTSRKYYYGGCFSSTANLCTVSSRSSDPTVSKVGLRLAMSNN